MTRRKKDDNGNGKDSKIQFFGRRSHNSGMPGWYFKHRLRELEEEIAEKEHSLSDPRWLPDDRKPAVREDLRRLQYQRDEIIQEMPKLNGGQMRRIEKCYDSLGKMIGDTLFTESQMKMGTVDPNEELTRSKAKIMDMPSEFMDLATAAGIPIGKDRKCSRDSMIKLWKLCGRLGGVETNVEKLRRDRVTGTYKMEHEMFKQFREEMAREFDEKLAKEREKMMDPEYLEWKKKKEK